jgi:1-acyl-sn-glycerol-3-phosphate acyltransferase
MFPFTKDNYSKRLMKNIIFIIYQPYKWLVFVPWIVLTTLFFGSLTVFLVVLTNPRIASFIGGAVWARLNSYMTPMFVSVSGREHIDKKQSYVIVSNHQSNYDIFVLYGWLGVDFRWVMKKELRKIPGLGIGCEKIGHIFIDRSNRHSAMAAIHAAKSKIVNGTSVIFFPEGSRSMDNKLGTFKRGAFKTALDLGIPVLPITIIGTRKILPPKTINLLPGRVKMIIHKPIGISGYTNNNLDELVKRTKEIIGDALEGQASGQLPAHKDIDTH